METPIAVPHRRYYLTLSKTPPKKPNLFENHMVWYNHMTLCSGKVPAITYDQWKKNEMERYNRVKKAFDEKNEIHKLNDVIVSRDTPISVIEDIENKSDFVKWISKN